jgi:hypothetical protein
MKLLSSMMAPSPLAPHVARTSPAVEVAPPSPRHTTAPPPTTPTSSTVVGANPPTPHNPNSIMGWHRHRLHPPPPRLHHQLLLRLHRSRAAHPLPSFLHPESNSPSTLTRTRDEEEYVRRKMEMDRAAMGPVVPQSFGSFIAHMLA